MHVLLTNDDGVDAPGLRTLMEELRPLCDLTVVAPHRQRSASGLAITLHRSLPVERRPAWDGVPVFACGGTPADCAAVGIYALAEMPVDLCISGINDGPNMGEDVLHSGTVGAALEARISGVPAAALSALRPVDGSPTRFDASARVAASLVRACMNGFRMPEDIILNLNVPPLAPEELAGARVVPQGRRGYGPEVRIEPGENGSQNYWVYGPASDADNPLDTDVGATRAGYVSITPITHRLTSDHVFEELRDSAVSQLLDH